MERLLEIMRQLRAPDGCPWDREQTHLSLRRYLLEEAAEAVDAISRGDAEEMADELGDVLLQVAFHAVIAEEEGTFDYQAVEEAIVAKLIRRHPHVFGDTSVADAEEVVSNWRAIKAGEKGGDHSVGLSPGHSVARGLPALMRAAEVGKAAGWSAGESVAGLGSSPEGVGRHLLAVAQHARIHGVDPELALREAIDAALEEESAG